MKRRAMQPNGEPKRQNAPERKGATLLRVRTQDIYGGFALSRQREDVTLLAASIAKHGLLSPLVVRHNAQAGRYALVCGARRLQACRMLGMEEVDVLLVEGNEEEAIACYLEEHWTRVPVSCMDEAKIAGREETGMLCAHLALPRESLLRRLRLRLLGEQVGRFVREQGLTIEQAEPLLMIPREDRRMEAASIIAQRSLSGVQARRLIAGAPPQETQPRDAGKRRAIRSAMQELSAMAQRLCAQGVDTNVSMHSQDGGICVQIMLKNGENFHAGQEKKAGGEN